MADQTYVNNELQIEEFILYKGSYYFQPSKVPPKHALLFGDNRDDSHDSHEWDNPFLSVEQISGKVVYIWSYPLLRMATCIYLDFIELWSTNVEFIIQHIYVVIKLRAM